MSQPRIEPVLLMDAVLDLHSATLVTDENGVITHVNQEFLKISGYLKHELIGLKDDVLKVEAAGVDFYNGAMLSVRNFGLWRGNMPIKAKNGESIVHPSLISAIKIGEEEVFYAHVRTDIQDKKSSEIINDLVFYDQLTGLPNRKLLLSQLHHAFNSSSRTSRYGAALMINVDAFKDVNDFLGSNAGDYLLQDIADRLNLTLRSSDIIARLGGDEFVVIIEDISCSKDESIVNSRHVGEKIFQSLSKPYVIDGKERHITFSIGITLFNGRGENDVLRQVDIAVQQVKRAGGNSFEFFDPIMQHMVNAHLELKGSLRSAIKSGQMKLYYQAQVNAQSYKVGMEALLRWEKSANETLLPHQFILIAESIGMSLEIGKWVVSAACARLAEWSQSAITKHLTLSINIGAKELCNPAFLSHTKIAIRESGINARLLKIEIDDTALQLDISKAAQCMNSLSALGLTFSLSGFGSGGASIECLKKLPVKQIKIAKSFISDIASNAIDQAIVRSIIRMADQMSIEAVAEGVETPEQSDMLLELGCKIYQGYLIGRPTRIADPYCAV